MRYALFTFVVMPIMTLTLAFFAVALFCLKIGFWDTFGRLDASDVIVILITSLVGMAIILAYMLDRILSLKPVARWALPVLARQAERLERGSVKRCYIEQMIRRTGQRAFWDRSLPTVNAVMKRANGQTGRRQKRQAEAQPKRRDLQIVVSNDVIETAAVRTRPRRFKPTRPSFQPLKKSA